MKLELTEFIRKNPDWKQILSEKPFFITIKEDETYYLFSYSQIDSDFSIRLVQECRGIIFRKSDMKPVCIPFFKFFNVQEGYSAILDWSTARVQEKIDGSIIKVWFDNGEWHVSTNGTIDAQKAALGADALLKNDCYYKNYDELFCSVFPEHLFFDTLQTNKTYMFEIVSLFNRVVVPYSETKIYHIGTRNNDTLKESNDDIGIEKPKEYDLHSVEECLKIAETLPFDKEGYVVLDKYYNRIKIKGAQYVVYHHLKGNGVVTIRRILDLIKSNGQDDFKAHFKEYREIIEKIEDKAKEFISCVESEFIVVNNNNYSNRKELALFVIKTTCPSAIFSALDGKSSSIKEWFWKQQNDKIERIIGE